MATIRVGDKGVTLQLTVNEGGSPLDISSASTKELLLLKPDNSTVTMAASFVTDGTDGQLEATSGTSPSDFLDPGTYSLFAHLVIGSWDGHSDAKGITVESLGTIK